MFSFDPGTTCRDPIAAAFGHRDRAVLAVFAAGALVIGAAAAVAPAAGQGFAPGSPEASAQSFYESFQSQRWGVMAKTLHPDALDLSRFRVMAVVRADETGGVAQRVFGRSPAGVAELDDEALFAGFIGAVFGFAPGMMQAMMTKNVTILGYVPEDSGDGPLAHVVVRSREPLSGTAPSTVALLTLARSDDAWKVQWSPELDVIASALISIPTGRGGH